MFVTMEFEIGRHYQTRDGSKVVLKTIGDLLFTLCDKPNVMIRTSSDGLLNPEGEQHEYDIVSEWREPCKYNIGDVVIRILPIAGDFFVGEIVGISYYRYEPRYHVKSKLDPSKVKVFNEDEIIIPPKQT